MHLVEVTAREAGRPATLRRFARPSSGTGCGRARRRRRTRSTNELRLNYTVRIEDRVDTNARPSVEALHACRDSAC